MAPANFYVVASRTMFRHQLPTRFSPVELISAPEFLPWTILISMPSSTTSLAAETMVAAAREVVEHGMEIRIVRGRNSGAEISSTGLNLVGS